jgi:hypothetical protein
MVKDITARTWQWLWIRPDLLISSSNKLNLLEPLVGRFPYHYIYCVEITGWHNDVTMAKGLEEHLRTRRRTCIKM